MITTTQKEYSGTFRYISEGALVYSDEWQNFMLLVKERRLPRGCNLRAVQVQMYQYYKAHCITTAQWAEFEADIHRLEPSLPWRLKSATEIGR